MTSGFTVWFSPKLSTYVPIVDATQDLDTALQFKGLTQQAKINTNSNSLDIEITTIIEAFFIGRKVQCQVNEIQDKDIAVSILNCDDPSKVCYFCLLIYTKREKKKKKKNF